MNDKPTICLVEQSKIIRDSIKSSIGSFANVSFQEYDTLESARTELEANDPDFLILSHHFYKNVFPSQTGLSLLKKIRAKNKYPIVLLSNSISEECAARYKDYGVIKSISKSDRHALEKVTNTVVNFTALRTTQRLLQENRSTMVSLKKKIKILSVAILAGLTTVALIEIF